MTAGFHNIRLPSNVEKGAHGGAEFHTTVQTLSSGNEARNQDWSLDLQSWDVGYGIQTDVDFFKVRTAFYGRRGRMFGFRFKDWSDFNVPDVNSGLTSEPIGIADGSNQFFQAIKTYDPNGPAPYVRLLTRLVDGTYFDPDTGSNVPNTVHVFDNGVLVSPSNYSVSETGLITFNTPPTNTHVISLAAEFDCPVRFDVDKFDLTLELFNAGTIQSLPIYGVREYSTIPNVFSAAPVLGLTVAAAMNLYSTTPFTNLVGGQTASATSLALTVPGGGVPSGACIFVGAYSSSNPNGCTDTAGNTYHAIPIYGGYTLFYSFNCSALVSGNSITVAVAGSAAPIMAEAGYATNIVTAFDPHDANTDAVAVGISSAPSVTSGTPIDSGEFFLAWGTANSSSAVFTQPGSWVGTYYQESSLSATQDMAGLQNLSLAPFTYAPTLGSSASWAMFIHGFKCIHDGVTPPPATPPSVGGVSRVGIVTAGGWTVSPVVGTYPLVFSGGGGTGAAGTVTISSYAANFRAIYFAASVQLTARGQGYTSAPTATLNVVNGTAPVFVVSL